MQFSCAPCLESSSKREWSDETGWVLILSDRSFKSTRGGKAGWHNPLNVDMSTCGQVSTMPAFDPEAVTVRPPWGKARYACDPISMRRDAVRLNSCASKPSVATYSADGSAAAEAISLTALS